MTSSPLSTTCNWPSKLEIKSPYTAEEASKDKEEIILADIDTEEDHLFRRNWGLFRDRRTDLYKEILTLEGKIKD